MRDHVSRWLRSVRQPLCRSRTGSCKLRCLRCGVPNRRGLLQRALRHRLLGGEYAVRQFVRGSSRRPRQLRALRDVVYVRRFRVFERRMHGPLRQRARSLRCQLRRSGYGSRELRSMRACLPVGSTVFERSMRHRVQQFNPLRLGVREHAHRFFELWRVRPCLRTRGEVRQRSVRPFLRRIGSRRVFRQMRRRIDGLDELRFVRKLLPDRGGLFFREVQLHGR